MYNDLARTAKKVGKYSGRSSVTWSRVEDEEIVESSERKGDNLYNMAEHCEDEAAKASSELHRIMVSSEPLKHHWRSAMKLNAFLAFLLGHPDYRSLAIETKSLPSCP